MTAASPDKLCYFGDYYYNVIKNDPEKMQKIAQYNKKYYWENLEKKRKYFADRWIEKRNDPAYLEKRKVWRKKSDEKNKKTPSAKKLKAIRKKIFYEPPAPGEKIVFPEASFNLSFK